MILKLLLNTQIIWMILIKTLKITIQIKNLKYKLFLIWLLICLVKKLNPIVTELFFWDRNLNISLAFITQSYFVVPKDIIQKIDKYEYLTGEEILPPDQRTVIEQANFSYSALGKAFEKQIKLKIKEKNK